MSKWDGDPTPDTFVCPMCKQAIPTTKRTICPCRSTAVIRGSEETETLLPAVPSEGAE
jgi:hypothetical protein